jgi:signal transduction histidine kinase
MNLSYKETSVKSQMESLYRFQNRSWAKKLKINITLSEIDNLIRTDEDILSHLLSNAIKFTNMDNEIGCFKTTTLSLL